MRSPLDTHRVGRVAAVAAAAMMLDALVDLLPRRSIGVVLAQSEPAKPDTVTPDTLEPDRLLIEGCWRVVSIEVNGTTNSSDDVRKITTENRRDGGWRLLVDGNEIAAGTSSINPAASPNSIDLEFTSGDSAGRTSYGIYETGKSSRRICYAEAGRPRPSDFSTSEGSGRIMVVFERVER
jgi:uncharacterized protein (TIGR03067 family)